jgi:septum formation protein
MLETLSGRVHVVTTRFAIANPTRIEHVESVATRVVFRPLEPDEIEAYVASGEGEDKAGGYAIQGGAASFVARIEGSYGAVVGLPLAEVSVALRRLSPGPTTGPR